MEIELNDSRLFIVIATKETKSEVSTPRPRNWPPMQKSKTVDTVMITAGSTHQSAIAIAVNIASGKYGNGVLSLVRIFSIDQYGKSISWQLAMNGGKFELIEIPEAAG